jgi:hypothetical protein
LVQTKELGVLLLGKKQLPGERVALPLELEMGADPGPGDGRAHRLGRVSADLVAT